MSKNKNRITKETLYSLIPMLIGIVLIIVALVMLVPTLWDYKQAEDTYDALNEEYVSVEGDISIEGGVDDSWWYENVNIYLDELKSINSDIVGWIRFDNIEIISYPILYSGDNDSYLRTDIYGKDSNSGCIFLEEGNDPDFNDCHSILYGHNMKNGGMFGQLKEYNTDGFYEDHQYFTIYTDRMAYRYQIFAYEDIPETDEVYTIGFSPDASFMNFINNIRKKSYIAPDIDVTQNDKVMTLSTCSTTGRRFVVHAVRVGEHTYQKQ